MQTPEAILIAGPTASGKSKLAVDLARRFDGEIINTDSMQIYPVLDILSARPDRADLEQVPHHLYGYAPLDKPYSVARWLEKAKQTAKTVWARSKVPIFVGGTGLYFKALEEGLAETPEIPEAIRAAVRSDLLQDGSEALHARLSALDPIGAENLKPGDSHRITRALEVVLATGKPLKHFQELQPLSSGFLQEKNCLRYVLMPDRSVLHERINARTDVMLEGGALSEVEALLALNLPLDATVMKAIGVPHLTAVIRGETKLEEARNLIQAATRQYAKRQSTWFRGQFGDQWLTIKAVDGGI